MSSRDKTANCRTAKFETFEPRIVFSVDSVVADLALQVQSDLEQITEPVQFSLSDAHESTGAEYVFNDYGFDGSGQTIAVIDSGIAWDHYALGGGFGENARVVGGWDFAEGDADPYDDGPAGFHGTHVAGIIGSDDAENRGVASGVDLVGLRVFDDSGAGSLEWVEQALQWVHDHKDDFANPITTVNLSLGVDWNADTVPGWATLEDEFAQLEADNIFISVAAGNAFSSYNTTGLAYPAVSEHVVPVASHDADGGFSDFSQRNDRVLVAPGSSIQSTVPGHLFGSSQSDGFLGASGTSQAAPYVAGASAVLRQAFEFVGQEDINQDLLYNHFRETATQFYDSVTGGVYHRLDLGAAIDAVIEDAHGQAAANATNLGTIGSGELVQGTIGKLTDVDAFSFVAGQSGQVSINIAESHDLNTVIHVDGQRLSLDGNTATFDVVAGREYNFAVSTDNGIGNYDLDIELRDTFQSIELGEIASRLISNQSVSGETWYSLTASQEGILTANVENSNVNLQIYDSSLNLVASSSNAGNGLRADAWARNGEQYFIKVVGQDSNFDLQLVNQVSLIDGHLQVNGTSGNDDISVQHDADGDQLRVTVSETNYQFSADQVSRVFVDSLGGDDHLTLNLEATGDDIYLVADSVVLSNSDFNLASGSFDSITVNGDTTDEVTFLDSAGDDQFNTSGTHSSMTGSGFSNTATGISNINAVSRSGNDVAILNGSEQNDHFTVTEHHVARNNASGQTTLVGFRQVDVDGHGGEDTLIVHGSQGTDQFHQQGNQTTANLDDQVTLDAADVELSIVVANNADDLALQNGTAGNEHLHSSEASSILTGNDYQNVVLNGKNLVVDVAGSGGVDTARVLDTAGDDQVQTSANQARITGNGSDRIAAGFHSITVVAGNGGTDHALFVGTNGSDTILTEATNTYIWGQDYYLGLSGFEAVTADGAGGNDVALLRGDDTDNSFRVSSEATEIVGAEFNVAVSDFETQRLDGRGGQNVVELDGFGQDDSISAEGSALVAFLNDTEIRAENFFWLDAETDDDQSSQSEFNAVDFWYSLHGDWEEVS